METIGINWNTLLGALGPTGILVWYLWHTQTRTFPLLVQTNTDLAKTLTNVHAATLEKALERFSVNVERLTSDFRADLKEERQARAQEIAVLRGTFRCSESAKGSGEL